MFYLFLFLIIYHFIYNFFEVNDQFNVIYKKYKNYIIVNLLYFMFLFFIFFMICYYVLRLRILLNQYDGYDQIMVILIHLDMLFHRCWCVILFIIIIILGFGSVWLFFGLLIRAIGFFRIVLFVFWGFRHFGQCCYWCWYWCQDLYYCSYLDQYAYLLYYSYSMPSFYYFYANDLQ